MYRSQTTMRLADLGQVSRTAVLDDTGTATLVLETKIATPEKTTSVLEVPPGMLSGLYSDVLRLLNLERGRKGLPDLKEFAYLDSDEDLEEESD